MQAIITVALVLSALTLSSAGWRDLLQLGASRPCFWQGSSCRANFEFSLALKPAQLLTPAAKVEQINVRCNQHFTNKAACDTDFVNGCTFARNFCRISLNYEAYLESCNGTFAQTWYGCGAKYTKNGCIKDPNCNWRPELLKGDPFFDPVYESCMPKKGLPATVKTAADYNLWYYNSIGSPNLATYTKYWSNCTSAQARFKSQNYNYFCAGNSKATCPKNCTSAPGYCVYQNNRYYDLDLAGGGLLQQQFVQCNNPLLKDKATCEQLQLSANYVLPA